MLVNIRNKPDALSNLYILLTRISCENCEDIPTRFLENLQKEEVEQLMDVFISSLNDLYKNNKLKQSIPQNCKEWLTLFQSTQYLSGISDPVEFFLSLSRRLNEDNSVGLKWMLKLHPLARARLVDFWGVKINAQEEEVKHIISENAVEASFIAAYLIDFSLQDEIPMWITKEVIELTFFNHWETAGRYLLQSTYGHSHRKLNERLQKKLEDYFDEILTLCFVTEKAEVPNGYFSSFLWPIDFVSFTNWLNIKEKDFNSLSKICKSSVVVTIVSFLKKEMDNVPEVLAENKSSNLQLLNLNEPKFQIMLSYLLLFLLEDKEVCKKLPGIFYSIKELYYGAWASRNLAEEYTELLLLLLLSCNNCYGFDDEYESRLVCLINKFTEILLYGYVLKAEEEEYIWNPQYSFGVQFHNVPKYLINDGLKKVSSSPISKEFFEKLFAEFAQYKTAKWPFEQD